MTAVTGAIRNGVTAETTFATPDPIKRQPELARFRFRADNRRIDGARNSSAIEGFHAAGHAFPRPADRPAGLTPREVEILQLLARGLLNKQIARLLGIAPKTVGNHVEHIYAKIGVSSRAAAGFFAAAHRLISFADNAAGCPAATVGTPQGHQREAGRIEATARTAE